jgi:hypothetical protein
MTLLTMPSYARFADSPQLLLSNCPCRVDLNIVFNYLSCSMTLLLSQLNVLELFLDCITEPNERLVEFGIGGKCNSCVGEYYKTLNSTIFYLA